MHDSQVSLSRATKNARWLFPHQQRPPKPKLPAGVRRTRPRGIPSRWPIVHWNGRTKGGQNAFCAPLGAMAVKNDRHGELDLIVTVDDHQFQVHRLPELRPTYDYT